jgi:outer membrane protein
MKRLPLKLVFVLGLSFAGVTGVSAQQASNEQTWSLEEAIEYARNNSLQIKQSRINVSRNEIDLRQAKYQRLPTLNASGSYNYNTGSYQNPVTFSLVSDASRSANVQASASVPLFMGFQQTNLIKQYGYDLLASEQDLNAAQNDLTLQIVTAYLNILFTQELIKTSELQRTTSQKQLDRTRILFKAGSLAENSVLDLESQLANDEVNIINAQNQRDITRLNLIQLLNLQDSKNFQIEIPVIPEPDQAPVLVNPELAYEISAQLQPAVKSADLRVLSAAKAVEVARGAYYPRISLFAGLNSRYSSLDEQRLVGRETVVGDNPIEQVFFRDRNLTQSQVFYLPNIIQQGIFEDYPIFSQFSDLLNRQVGVSMNIPIFNGLQARSNVQRAQLAEMNANLNAQLARNQLRQTIEQAYVDALSAQRKYAAAKVQVEALERSYNNAQLRLENGFINTVDFSVVTNNYRNALSNLLQAKYEYTFKLKVLDFYQGKNISF